MVDKRIKISSIRIENFRSIRNEQIQVKDFNIFVGLNDSGKSNILKALNLFFNGETDYGKQFVFQNDFTFFFPKKSHKPKEIIISIKFEIPDTYSEAGEYTWKKVWRADDIKETIVNAVGDSPTAKSRIPGALHRIRYRYVPAVKSSDYYKALLGDLYTAVFSSLNNPLAESVESFSSTLKNYTEELSANIQKQLDLASVLSFPDDLNDIFKSLVFETSSNSTSFHVPLTSRGDGIQARHIPIILHYIAHEDQKSRNRGSMKVCTIWGFEEPENGLELLKTFNLADEFEKYSYEIQMFVSTHSPAFYMKKKSTISQVFFVSKRVESDETDISSEIENHFIAESMGLMPLVAPFIEEQSQRLMAAEKIYKENVLTDVPTIFVEGETDIAYLKIAIAEHSDYLHQLIDSQKLRIICKNGGAGTTSLVDWTFAWIFSGFKSKLFVLFDKDAAGIEAKNELEHSEIYKSKQNSLAIRMQYIEPSDDIITLLKKRIKFEYEIEHLLSIDFWKEIKRKNYLEFRTEEELNRMFIGLVPRDKSLDSVIDDLVENTKIRDTILTFSPRDIKKGKIVKFLENHEDKYSATIGFKRTIQKIEAHFQNL